jgi:hypothetical protein
MTTFEHEKTDALQNLTNGKATEENITLLKYLLVNGEILIDRKNHPSVFIKRIHHGLTDKNGRHYE